jgi:hypothetical protein
MTAETPQQYVEDVSMRTENGCWEANKDLSMPPFYCSSRNVS